MKKLNVGAMVISDRDKGLSVDARVLSDSIRSVADINIFPLHALPPTDDPGHVYATGTSDRFKRANNCCTFSDWFGDADLDVMIFIEFIPRRCAQLCLDKNIRVVLIANLDWATHDYTDDKKSTEWVEWVKDKQIEVWAKTKSSVERLNSVGITAVLGTWTTNHFPVIPSPPTRSDKPFTFLFNGGTLRHTAYGTRRNVECAIDAFDIAQTTCAAPIAMIIKVIAQAGDCGWLLKLADGIKNLTFLHGHYTQGQMDELHASVDCVLYPSRWEGFGLSCLEALHAGRPVICTDGTPMNEIVTHNHDGLCVKAKHVGWHNLAPRYEVDRHDFADSMKSLATNARLQARLTMPDQTELRSRHIKTCEDIKATLAGEGARVSVLVIGAGASTQRVRSEKMWALTLREMGIRVTYCYAENEPGVRSLCESGKWNFVLAGKLRLSLAKEIGAITKRRGLPLVFWLHDNAQFSPERAAHFRGLEKAATLYFGADATHKLHPPGVRVLVQGVSLWSDRGEGKRGTYASCDGRGGGVVFVGNRYSGGAGEKRNNLIDRMGHFGAVSVYGAGWGCEDTAVDGRGQADVYKNADAIFCVSSTNKRRWITSNRLVDALASGNRLIVERFSGIEDIVRAPASYVAFHTHTDAFEAVGKERARAGWFKLLGDDLQGEINAHVAYNHLSWRKMVGVVLCEVNDWVQKNKTT